jgi:hypothetical protein
MMHESAWPVWKIDGVVIRDDRCAICSFMLKIIPVLDSCFVTPSIASLIARLRGSGICADGVIHGPSGQLRKPCRPDNAHTQRQKSGNEPVAAGEKIHGLAAQTDESWKLKVAIQDLIFHCLPPLLPATDRHDTRDAVTEKLSNSVHDCNISYT